MNQTALLATAVWWACDATLLRPVARRLFGDGELHALSSTALRCKHSCPLPPLRSAEWTDGYPRWGVVLGVFSQLVGFPVLFFAFALGRQVPQLGLASSHTHLRTPTRPTRTLWSTYGAVPQEWLMEFFLLVFACVLVQDCVRFPTTMGPLLLAQKKACLVGILVARLAPGAGAG